ncbi:MAG: hypothetical protein BWY37_00961 [Firmicutes bacterium ADurb.Bin262]|nr:MAG: hypothetical protein BWY37_00961 [Firmicutes bacterium ADurb.Bin262]
MNHAQDRFAPRGSGPRLAENPGGEFGRQVHAALFFIQPVFGHVGGILARVHGDQADAAGQAHGVGKHARLAGRRRKHAVRLRVTEVRVNLPERFGRRNQGGIVVVAERVVDGVVIVDVVVAVDDINLYACARLEGPEKRSHFQMAGDFSRERHIAGHEQIIHRVSAARLARGNRLERGAQDSGGFAHELGFAVSGLQIFLRTQIDETFGIIVDIGHYAETDRPSGAAAETRSAGGKSRRQYNERRQYRRRFEKFLFHLPASLSLTIRTMMKKKFKQQTGLCQIFAPARITFCAQRAHLGSTPMSE